MRRLTAFLLIVMLILSVAAIANEHAFTGAKKCSICHKGEKNGMVFENWQKGPHAKAFTILGEQAALDVYAELGKSGNPQEDPECLKCHVTGFGTDASLTEKLIKENGVTCETCHGAGGDYWKKSVMQDRETAVANGMNPDPKAKCVTCHNEENPTYKEFIVEERWAQIEHERPKGE